MNFKQKSKPILKNVDEDQLYIAQNISMPFQGKDYRCFSTNKKIQYFPFCDDFGPVNISSVSRFVDLVENELQNFRGFRIIYLVDEGRRSLTNAGELIGSDSKL